MLEDDDNVYMSKLFVFGFGFFSFFPKFHNVFPEHHQGLEEQFQSSLEEIVKSVIVKSAGWGR